MDEISKDKREVSAYIPYRKKGDTYEYFLQKRTLDAPTHPGLLGMFGGGIEEGEHFERAFFREVSEELDHVPANSEYWSRFESNNRIFHLYIEEVVADFEQVITVNEGEYGVFVKAGDVVFSTEATDTVRYAIGRLDAYLSKKTD